MEAQWSEDREVSLSLLVGSMRPKHQTGCAGCAAFLGLVAILAAYFWLVYALIA